MIAGIVASQLVVSAPSVAYSTWDPANTYSELLLSNNNLTVTKNTADALRSTRSTLGVTSGKHYIEIRMDMGDFGPYILVGVGTSGVLLSDCVGRNASGWAYYEETGQKMTNNVTSAFGASWQVNGTIIGIALDMTTGSVWFSKNGVWQGSGDPSAGTNPAFTGLTGTIYMFASLYQAINTSKKHQVTANFGASAFTYPVPSGFRSGFYQ